MANDSILMKSIGACSASAVLGGLIAYKIFKHMDPQYEDKNNEKKRVAEIMATFKLDPKETKLTSHETHIASLISTFVGSVIIDEVGASSTVLQQLHKNIILPLRPTGKFTVPSVLFTSPKGVLLYGPHGCGKTLIARAIAKEASAFFINFDNALLNEMFYGETANLMRALFTLASKIQPCIIFIDEIDSVLRNDATVVKKTQFMSLWDEFLDADSTVIIIGATHRPQDVDEAIMYRLPLKIQVPLPNLVDRARILRVILRDENLADDFNFEAVAQATETLSGADLKEVIRFACLSCYESVVEKFLNAPAEQRNEQRIAAVKLSHTDVIQAFKKFKTPNIDVKEESEEDDNE